MIEVVGGGPIKETDVAAWPKREFLVPKGGPTSEIRPLSELHDSTSDFAQKSEPQTSSTENRTAINRTDRDSKRGLMASSARAAAKSPKRGILNGIKAYMAEEKLPDSEAIDPTQRQSQLGLRLTVANGDTPFECDISSLFPLGTAQDFEDVASVITFNPFEDIEVLVAREEPAHRGATQCGRTRIWEHILRLPSYQARSELEILATPRKVKSMTVLCCL